MIILKMKVLNDVGSKYQLLAKIRNFLENWQQKPSKEKFQILYNIPKTMFELVGVRVFSDLKLNYYSHLGNVMIFYYVSMVTHTIYYWSKRDKFIFGTRCLCGMGIMISVKSIVSNLTPIPIRY